MTYFDKYVFLHITSFGGKFFVRHYLTCGDSNFLSHFKCLRNSLKKKEKLIIFSFMFFKQIQKFCSEEVLDFICFV